MATFGVVLEPSSLELYRRRDFRCTATHYADGSRKAESPFPAGKLFFELETGGASSASQLVELDRVSGGTFTLTLGGVTTAGLAYNAKAAAVQAALEALAGVGVGNVLVSADVTPVWVYTGSLTGVTPNAAAIKSAVETLFSGVSGLSGVDVVFTFNNPGFEIEVRSRKSFTEPEFSAWTFNSGLVDAVATKTALDKVTTPGVLTVTQLYCPKRVFHVGFQGALADTPMGVLAVNSAGLSGQKQTATPRTVSAGQASVTTWEFTISGAKASLKVEETEVDKIANRTRFQLVWLPAGEPSGGDPVAVGSVKVHR